MDFSHVNFFAVCIAALSSFALAAIWYSPLLFQKVWLEECGLMEVDLKSADPKWIFGGNFILSLVIALTMALFLGPDVSLGYSVGAAFVVGVCWVSSAFAMTYIVEQRPLKLFMINSGYQVLQFTLMGLVLGL